MMFEMYDEEKHKKDIEYILNNIRDEEVAEIRESGDCGPAAAIDEALGLSDRVCIIREDVPVCILGAVKDTDGGAVLWIFTTNDADRYKKAFARSLKAHVKDFVSEYGFLYNYVPLWYRKATRLLEYMGAFFYDKEIFGDSEYILWIIDERSV